MSLTNARFFIVLIRLSTCVEIVAEGNAVSSSGEHRSPHSSPATMPGECSSLLQVDMARTSQIQKISAGAPNEVSDTEVQVHDTQKLFAPLKPGIRPESQIQDSLLVTFDALKRTHTSSEDRSLLNQLGEVVTSASNGTVMSQDHVETAAEFIQKPYLELHIYFDLLLILFAIVLFFLLPQALGAKTAEDVGSRTDLPPFLPALSTLKYLAVVTVWMKHHWFEHLFDTVEFVLMLSGFILEYAQQRVSEDADAGASLQSKYQQFLPRRFARLYPLFALHVIFGLLSPKHASTCDPIRALLLYQCWGYGTGTFDGGKLVYYSCGIGTWFVSVIFGCYFLFPILSRPMRHLPSAAVPMLWVACSILIILPRALASPAGNVNCWWSDVHHPGKVPVGFMELLITKKSLLHGLAHFFMGMVLARSWVSSILLGMSDSEAKGSLIIRYGCMLGAIALGVQWITAVKHPETVPGNGYGIRMMNEAWKVTFQSVLMLGAAGPLAGNFDPLRGLLSMRCLAWMGELALPLYLSVSWACDFSDKLMLQMGVSAKGSFSQGTYFVSQLVVMHVIALTIYQSCGALSSRAAKADVKEALS